MTLLPSHFLSYCVYNTLLKRDALCTGLFVVLKQFMRNNLLISSLFNLLKWNGLLILQLTFSYHSLVLSYY